MSDPLKQHVSQFLDDDLGPAESLHLLKALQEQPELQAKLHRYSLINQALKARPALLAESDFADQIKQRIMDEPAYLLPKRKPAHERYKIGAVALAASIMGIAVIAPTLLKNNMNPDSATIALARQQSRIPIQAGLLPNRNQEPVRMYPVNQRFQGYLQAHNGSLYTNNASTLQYRSQLANYGQRE